MRENRLSGSMRGGARRSLAFGLSIRRLRLLYTGVVLPRDASIGFTSRAEGVQKV